MAAVLAGTNPAPPVEHRHSRRKRHQVGFRPKMNPLRPAGPAPVFRIVSAAPRREFGDVLLLHPTSTPGFVRHVEARRARIRSDAPGLLPAEPKPLVLEIGCGHGHYLVRHAAAHPDRFCLGIDLLARRLERATRKRESSQLGNVQFYRAEAREFLDCLPDPVRFAEVFLLFPDPWPKKRHHKHRIMNPVFLAALAQRMTAGGRLFFRTDHLEYFSAAREIVETHAAWRLLRDAPWPFEEATIFQKKAPSFQSLIAEVTGARLPGAAVPL